MADKKPHLLVIEDDPGIQKQLKWSFEQYEVLIAEDRASAIKRLRQFDPAVVTLDLGLPPDPANASEGIATLSDILELSPSTKVVVVTGNDDHENALRAISLGAYDYYQKPIDPETLGVILQRAYYLHRLEEENRQLQTLHSLKPSIKGIIGNAPSMQKIFKTVDRIATTQVTTLLLGESGTGKELFAHAVHDGSSRAKGPFVAINCASIPESLLESELYGYEKGAFTGAHKTTEGKIESAQGGTLFLDEIGDMPISLQAKLLRFLQERTIERIGGRKEIPVDVRVICATHQDLVKMAAEGDFREDLYYRISEVTIRIPPLRERDGDTMLIARALLHECNQKFGRQIKGFSDPALQAMAHYNWPGNIRELENRIKSAVLMAEGKLITESDLELESAKEQLVFNLRQTREVTEKRLINQVFSYTNNNVSRAAELLGVTRPTLYALMDKYHFLTDKCRVRSEAAKPEQGKQTSKCEVR